MGSSRESQNLFYYIKIRNWRNFWRFIKHFNKTTYEDTFMPIICKMIGHIAYQFDKDCDPNEWACKRCHRYIVNYNPRKEKLKKLNKIK
jgi:hypothetical protein